jgi:nucleotide-binding universal stress UspA family protein
MNIFVPYDDSDLSRFALREACRMVTSLDRIFVMATVIVPLSLDIHVSAGEVWKQTCSAEIRLASARSYAERLACRVDVRYVRVQAHSRTSAIIAGAIHYEANTILFAQRAGLWSRFASLFSPMHTVLRHAPCDVHVVYTAVDPPSLPYQSRYPSSIVRFIPRSGSSNSPERAVRGVPDSYPVRQHGGSTPYASE